MELLSQDDPRALGGYRLLGRLGAGGMGRVYLGRSAGGRTVAVKAVHAHFAADDQFRARFRREIESARRVGGDWTAPVLDADPDASVPWIATGYVAGPSLAQAVAETGPLAGHTVRALGAGLAEALAAVHALGLVHRDVKPSNVLLTLDGPLLIDFGIARATEGTASLTSTGVSVGSPGYMAPEQILGNEAAGAADVFSLGAVLAFAATGLSPFPGDSSAALLYKVVHEEPVLGPQLGGELRESVAACLAKNPADRPAPRALAARLAGEGSGGAAGLVRAGWLPGPLVERVSRQAVELLNLEAGEEPAAGAPARAGHGPAGAVPGPASAVPGGAFGPRIRRTGRCPGWCRSTARSGPGRRRRRPPVFPLSRPALRQGRRRGRPPGVCRPRRQRGPAIPRRTGGARRPPARTVRRPPPISPDCRPGRRRPPPRSGGSRCPVRSPPRRRRGSSSICCRERAARRTAERRRAPGRRPTAHRRPGPAARGTVRPPWPRRSWAPGRAVSRPRTASRTARSPASSKTAARVSTSSTPPMTRCW